MPVIPAPPQTDTDERTLDERVAELEALINEARLRARRRRQRNAAVVVAALLAAGAAAYARGHGIRVGAARSADGGAVPAAALERDEAWSVPTGPPGFRADIVLHPTKQGGLFLNAGGRVYRSTDAGRAVRGAADRTQGRRGQRRPTQRLGPLRRHERGRAQEHRRRAHVATRGARADTK